MEQLSDGSSAMFPTDHSIVEDVLVVSLLRLCQGPRKPRQGKKIVVRFHTQQPFLHTLNLQLMIGNVNDE